MQKIEEGFKEWKCLAEELTVLFHNRNRKEAKEPMEKAFHLYKDLSMYVGMSYENVKVLNEGERIHFIEYNIDHYHSFIQLKELYTELEKVYFKCKVMKKSTGM